MARTKKVPEAVEPMEPTVLEEAPKSMEDRIAELEVALDHYKALAERAFEKSRDLENQLDSVETFYRKRLKFIDETIATLRSTITIAVKGDL